jgi:peptidoglycan/LPS O-acetylase OafA/YrhL
VDSGLATTRAGFAVETIHRTGWYGVQLFFGLSGFLLALPFARSELAGAEPVKLSTYFMRRATRLEPPYLLMLVGVFALDYAAGVPRMDFRHLAACLGYQHGTIYGSMNAMNGATWSLETEVQFYCLTPLLAPIIYRLRRTVVRRGILVFGMVAFSAIAARSRLAWEPRWIFCVLGHLHEFLAGYLLADVYVHDWNERPPTGRGWAWDCVSVIGWAAIPFILTTSLRYPLWLDLALPFIVFALYCAALRGRVSRWVFSRTALVAIGGACYSIYLLHGPVLRGVVATVGKLVPKAPADAMFLSYCAASLPVILAASGAYFLAVERPCMDPRWPARVVGSIRGRAQPPGLTNS